MIKVQVKNYPPTPEYITEYIDDLDMKKSLAGHLMIYNHKDIAIVVKTEERKIVAYSRGNFSDIIYNAQNRFFNYLVENGVVQPETVRGTNVFGALAAEYPDNKDIQNLTEIVLYNISGFIKNETEYMEAITKAEMEREENLLDPSSEDSTELGEVPQETTKGTQQPYYPGYSYGLAGIYRYE
jgi:hypothetical protein